MLGAARGDLADEDNAAFSCARASFSSPGMLGLLCRTCHVRHVFSRGRCSGRASHTASLWLDLAEGRLRLDRLGRNGAEEIKAHPFFAGVDWDSLRKIDAPFKPQLKSMVDTSYFPTDELENVPDAPAVAAAAQQQGTLAPPAAGEETGLPFIGYTYKRL